MNFECESERESECDSECEWEWKYLKKKIQRKALELTALLVKLDCYNHKVDLVKHFINISGSSVRLDPCISKLLRLFKPPIHSGKILRLSFPCNKSSSKFVSDLIL